MIVELLVSAEESGSEVIEENCVAGDLVVTNLARRLTPVVRYPTGDRAEWVDYKAGVFRLLGRSGTSIRLGPVSVDMQDLRRIAAKAIAPQPILGIQAVLMREDGKDCLQISIAPGNEDGTDAVGHVGEDDEALRCRVLEHLWEERPMLLQHIHMGLTGNVTVKFVAFGDLVVNERSGKLVSVLDLR